MNRCSYLVIFCLVVIGWTARARVFQNSYVQFNLPDNWNCHQEGAAFVCAPVNTTDARQALIISTAKLASPDDSLNSFDAYLRQPKTLISKSKSQLSQPISIARKKVGNQDWVQAVHLGSEVPNFTTRYMATVKQKLAVLVSFSADSEFKAKYDPVFDQIIQSLRVDASKPVLMRPFTGELAQNKEIIGQALPVGGGMVQAEPAGAKQKKLWLFGLIALAAIGGLFVFRKLV